MTQTQWKDNSKEGFTGNNNRAEDSHTRSILEKLNKLRKIREKETFENFANIKPLETIFDTFVKRPDSKPKSTSKNNKDNKNNKKNTVEPLQEGLDNGMFNGVDYTRLDDEDYDGHDNVDDEGAEIDAQQGLADAINWLREAIKYTFIIIETFFYISAIFIYLAFSGEDKESKWNDSFVTPLSGENWRTQFNENEQADIDLIFSYILFGASIMFSSVITYGLYFYMFYSETKEQKLNAPDEAVRPTFCSLDLLTPFFSLNFDYFKKFYKSYLYSDGALSLGQEKMFSKIANVGSKISEKVKKGKDVESEIIKEAAKEAAKASGKTLLSWIYSLLSPLLYLTYIALCDSMFAMSKLHELIIDLFPQSVKDFQKYLGDNFNIKFSNALIFFVLAIIATNIIFYFGGSVKKLILDGLFKMDLGNSGMLGVLLILILVLPSFLNLCFNFTKVYSPPPQNIGLQGFMNGIFDMMKNLVGQKEEKPGYLSSFKKSVRNEQTKQRMDNEETFIDTYGYLWQKEEEWNNIGWNLNLVRIMSRYFWNFFRFSIGLMCGLFILPIFFLIYIILFMVINPIVTLGTHYTQMTYNIDAHRNLNEDEFYNLFYVNSQGKFSKIDDAEVKRVVEQEYPDPNDGITFYSTILFDVIFKISKNVFYFAFLLLFVVLFAYAASDISTYANNDTLQRTLPPLLYACFGLFGAMYLFKVYKKVTADGGDTTRFIRDFLGVVPPSTNQEGGGMMDMAKRMMGQKIPETNTFDLGNIANMVSKNIGDAASVVSKIAGDAKDAVVDRTTDIVSDVSNAFDNNDRTTNIDSNDGTRNKINATEEDIVNAFKSAKGKTKYYAKNRWETIFVEFKKILRERYNNNIQYESKEESTFGTNLRNIQNMKKDEWKRGVYRYLTSEFQDYMPLRAIFKSAASDHPVNTMFSQQECANK